MNFLTISSKFVELWLCCSCEQVYGKRHEIIPDLDLDLTYQVSSFRLCFRLCSQVVGVLGFRAPMPSSMRVCWPVWAWHNSTFFSGNGLMVSRC
ncbi:hypothetical protein SCLCIDRAFT_597005 [Scleroderma citrinum Foug A]|uniref:Uncharacterized protein n=1 Tax=Scleroderma citrinum Foug A TaxID=1036808 RepID=A0A0C3DW82_9AGAM|nr:hypothetical protein SCLCIDRAFT_597005 [Scleroderma citrinum Foug A]